MKGGAWGLILLAGCSLTARAAGPVGVTVTPAGLMGGAVETSAPVFADANTAAPTGAGWRVARVCADGLNVRDGPGVEGVVLDWLARGDLVRVYSVVDGWAFVEVAGRPGWVKVEFLCE